MSKSPRPSWARYRQWLPLWTRLWARDSLVLVSTQATALVLTTALAIVVARYLGPSDFGIFAGVLGLSAALTVLAASGPATWLLRELANEGRGDGRPLSGTARGKISGALGLTAVLAVGFSAAAVVTTVILASQTDVVAAVAGLMGYTGLIATATVVESVFRAERNYRPIVVATAVEKPLLLLLVLGAVLADAGIPSISAAYLGAGVARLAYDLWVLRRGGGGPMWRPALTELVSVFHGMLPFAIASTTATAIVRLDTFVIGLFSTLTAGFYAVADRFLGVLLVVSAAAASSLFPLIARETNPLRTSWRLAAIFTCLGGILCVPLLVTAPWLVPLFFGESYEPAVVGVQIMLLAAPLIFGGSVLMAGMYSAGYERQVAVVAVIFPVVGTAFVVLGQKLDGLSGAAIGFVCRFVIFVTVLALISRTLEKRTTLARDTEFNPTSSGAAPASSPRSRSSAQ